MKEFFYTKTQFELVQLASKPTLKVRIRQRTPFMLMVLFPLVILIEADGYLKYISHDYHLKTLS